MVTTSELDWLDPGNFHLLPSIFSSSRKLETSSLGTEDFLDLIERHRAQPLPIIKGSIVGPNDPAFLTYTSGTTGNPKGAINTHHNIVFNSHSMRTWLELTERDVIMGAAPCFHITGLLTQVTVPFLVGCPVVLHFRFHPVLVAELIEKYKATNMNGAITMYIAMLNDVDARKRNLSSLMQVTHFTVHVLF